MVTFDELSKAKVITKSIAGVTIVGTTGTLLYAWMYNGSLELPLGTKEILLMVIGGAVAKLFGDN